MLYRALGQKKCLLRECLALFEQPVQILAVLFRLHFDLEFRLQLLLQRTEQDLGNVKAC